MPTHLLGQASVLEQLRVKYRRQLRRLAPALVADLPEKEPKANPSERELEKLKAWNEAARKFKEGA